ncbi:MAG TPA: 30S ribosomal protein S6 [Armatimonadetes bacterium]|nr:30S ribosomal protein S6 [Armatimonadota bacterium]
MRDYELTYIIDPALEEDQVNALVERFSTLVTSNGGEVANVDRWEKRKLAYDINGRREGLYVVMTFRGTPELRSELDRQLRITEGVIRHLIVRPEE